MQNNITIRHAIESDEPFTLDVRYKAWLKAYNHIFSEENIHKHFPKWFLRSEYLLLLTDICLTTSEQRVRKKKYTNTLSDW